ncbi:MAG TPA: ABC transporter ATP-binding protein [Solirubrobacterales bacterium]|jgi:lipopolysaccharide transport system ATP-binding protein|nr:ABC transporter ATP-binding protein [Solirubrobacterales bacterium]
MSDVAIETNRLAKRYTLGTGRRGYDTLRESLVATARRSLGRLTRRPTPPLPEETLWALRELTIEIGHGEVVGLIGHNGAGKSTLLKILSRITEPTSGWAEVHGRVGSLLEVGTGFHPELTGRENVFLNGAILGMRRAEIRRRFDEIVAFADIERFLDTPVKRYSSGMSVRLAFAVAAHLEPEILLVDEVLAVGDAAFQRKSLGKMGEVAREGRTVVFVSHNLAVIQALCTRGILLEGGRAVADAPVEEAIDCYLRGLERAASADLLARTDRDSRGWEASLIRGLEVRNPGGAADVVVGGRPVRIAVAVTEVVPMMECRLTIVNSLGQPIATLDSEVSAPADVRDGELGPRIECDLEALPLLPGRYRIDVLLKGRRQIQDGLQAAAFFDVEPGVIDERPMPTAGSDGDIALAHRWRLPG